MKKLSKTSVSDLVLSAIFSLQQKNGVSATEITKYICSKRGYKKKDAKELVRKALTRATENGIFTKKGGLYRIDTQSSKEPKLLKKNLKKKTLKSKPMKTNDLQDITNDLIQYDVKLKKFDKPNYSKNSRMHVARPLHLTSRFSRSLSKPDGNEEPNEVTDSFNKNEDYDDDDDDDDDYLEDEEDDSEDEINFFDDDQDGSRTSEVAVDAGPRCKKPKPKKKPAKGRCRPKKTKRCRRKKKSKRCPRDKKKRRRKSAKCKSKNKSKTKSKDKPKRCPTVRDKTKLPEEPKKEAPPPPPPPPPSPPEKKEEAPKPPEEAQKPKVCKNKDGTIRIVGPKANAKQPSSKPNNSSKPPSKDADPKTDQKPATKDKTSPKEGGAKAKYRRRYMVDAENFQPNSTDNELEVLDVDSGEDLLNLVEDEKFIDEYWDLNIDEDTDENLEKCEHKEGDECCNDNSSENGRDSRSPSAQREEKSHRRRPDYKSVDSDDDDNSKSELTKEDDFDPDDSEGSYKSHSNKRKYDNSYEFDRLRAKYPKKKKKAGQ